MCVFVCVGVPTDNLLASLGQTLFISSSSKWGPHLCRRGDGLGATFCSAESDFQGRQRLFSPASSRRNRKLVSSLRGDRKTGRLLRKTERVKKRTRDTEMEDNKLSLSSAAVNGCSSAGLNANRPGVFRQAAGACTLTSPPL